MFDFSGKAHLSSGHISANTLKLILFSQMYTSNFGLMEVPCGTFPGERRCISPILDNCLVNFATILITMVKHHQYTDCSMFLWFCIVVDTSIFLPRFSETDCCKTEMWLKIRKLKVTRFWVATKKVTIGEVIVKGRSQDPLTAI